MKKEKILEDHEIDAAGQKLRPYFNQAAEALSPQMVQRLAKAREAAVSKLAARESQTASNVLASGNTLSMSNGSGWKDRLGDWRFWLTGLIAASAVALYLGSEWRETVRAREGAEVELMILGDDVPVDALLDKGFNSFLREENK